MASSSSVAEILNGLPATRVTRQLVSQAQTAGLRPHVQPPYRGSYQVYLDAGGIDGLFGALVVGASTGRILRAYFTRGNYGVERRYDIDGARILIQSWAAIKGRAITSRQRTMLCVQSRQDSPPSCGMPA